MDRFEDKDQEKPVHETKAAIKARIKYEKTVAHLNMLKEKKQDYNPDEDKNIKGDPSKTLIVARLNYETTEHTLER